MSNCQNCNLGVMEQIGSITDEGKIVIDHPHNRDQSKDAIQILACSRCGHTKFQTLDHVIPGNQNKRMSFLFPNAAKGKVCLRQA